MTYTELEIAQGGACYYQGGLFTGTSTTYVYKANVEGYDRVIITSAVYSNELHVTFFSSDSVFDSTTMLEHFAPSASGSVYTDAFVVPSEAKAVCFGWYGYTNSAKSAVGGKYEEAE